MKARHPLDDPAYVSLFGRTPLPPAFDAEAWFDDLWEEILRTRIPVPVHRKEALRHVKASVRTQADADACRGAIASYARSERVRRGFVKDAHTFFNNWPDFINFRDPAPRLIDEPPTDRDGAPCGCVYGWDDTIKCDVIKQHCPPCEAEWKRVTA